jgi:hypothetical protein
MLVSVLVILSVFAGFNVISPVNAIGKTPPVLKNDVATVAVVIMLVMITALAYVTMNIGGHWARLFEVFTFGIWFVRLFVVVALVGRVRTRPVSAGAAVYEIAWNIAILAGFLYLLTLAV